MNVSQIAYLDGEVMGAYWETIWDCSGADSVGVQAAYAPIGNGSGTIKAFSSIDGIHFTEWVRYRLTVDSADSSLWCFSQPFYKFLKFTYDPIGGEVVLSLTALNRDNTIVRS